MTNREIIQVEQQEEKPLTLYVYGGGTLFRAHCPELDISYYAETVAAAKQGLFSLAEAEVKGILQGEGGLKDERTLIAEHLSGVNIDEGLFQINPGPPPHRPGLK